MRTPQSPFGVILLAIIVPLVACPFLFFRSSHAADLRLLSIRVTNNDVRLNWNAPGGSNYVVQFATPLSSNFVNLGPSNSVPAGADQPLSYTHVGARTSAQAGFYRVHSFRPPRLEIQPTNAMIAPGMTNRFKVFLISSDSAPVDVTTNGALSVISSNTSVAQFVRVTTNGFVTVRGLSQGITFVRAAYQGLTNAVPLTVTNLTGGMYTVPASFSGFVEGFPSSAQVFGVFGTRTNNITPASELGGFASGVTRVSYNLAADVANSFALLTGQSAASDSIVFTAGASTSRNLPVNWCDFVYIAVDLIEISVGQTAEITLYGVRANGLLEIVSDSNINGVTFDSNFSEIARIETPISGWRVVGLHPGQTSFLLEVANPVNCGNLQAYVGVTVTPPPSRPVITNQPVSQTVVVGSNATFSVVAGGTAPLSYQWQFAGADISGATGSSVTISNAGFAQQGDYRVIVSNAYGGATSDVAALTIVAPPFANTQTPSVLSATTATLNGIVTANGGAATAWFEWGTNTAYAQRTGLTSIGSGNDVKCVSAAIAGLSGFTQYHCRLAVSNAAGVVTGADRIFSTSGNVVAWGYNNGAQTNVPNGLTNAVAVSGGDVFSLALLNNGQVKAWGTNSLGQTNVPLDLTNAVAISAGSFHSLSLRSDGRVTGWGHNGFNQTNVPANLNGSIAVAAGVYHSMALRSNGTVVAWGDNSSGQTNVPAGLSNVVAIADGSWLHSLALRDNGTVVVWGANSVGQTNVPAGLNGVVAIAAGYHHNLALRSNGVVIAWGENGLLQTNVPPNLTNVVAIAAGAYHSLALKADGQLVAWGWNLYGQTNQPTGATNLTAIAGGYAHNLGIKTP
jgi:hypothetical protein